MSVKTRAMLKGLASRFGLILMMCVFAGAAAKNSKIGVEGVRTVLSEKVVTIQFVSRKWKDKSGKQVAQGKLQRVIGPRVVVVEGTDGTITKLHLDTLAEADQSLIRKAASIKRPLIYFPVGKRGVMRIRYNWPEVFLLQDSAKFFLGFVNMSYREGGKTQELTGGFLKVDGKATKLTVESSDDEVLAIKQEERPAGTGYVFRFLKGGRVVVKVTIGDRRVLIPIRVTELPVTEGTPVQDVIEKLGLPKKKEIVYCSWPESKSKDSIFYNPDAGQSIIAAQHWEIEKHPVCILSMVGGRVYDVGLDDDFTLGMVFIEEHLAWLDGKLDDIVEEARKKPRLKPSAKPAAKSSPYVFRTWTDSAGKFTVEAKFRGVIAGKVRLEKANGKAISVPIERLSKEDQDWIRARTRK